jgi:hypothetical protein
MINRNSFETPDELSQQKRVVDYCNMEENAQKSICSWFGSLSPDPDRPEVTPVTEETRLDQIFRTSDADTPPSTLGVEIPEGFYNFDMSCDSCGNKPAKGDCPTTIRNLAMGNIEDAFGTESQFTSSYAPF